MFGSGHTYFAGSPVVITINGLDWPKDSNNKPTSPFNIVQMDVIYNNAKVGNFHADTGGQGSFSFDISSALRAIWADYDFGTEVQKATDALTGNSAQSYSRSYRNYSLEVFTEYMAADGTFTSTNAIEFNGGQCMLGGLTELERSLITDDTKRDAAALEGTNLRYGDASTKPTSSPERVGRDSITSWTDVSGIGTMSVFYPKSAQQAADGTSAHAPTVLRDESLPYVDFLFVNRRGAVETCSALMLENMGIDVESKQYGRVERPTFRPSRSLMAVGSDGRRSWQMSSGYQTREWAEWWTMEFLGGRRKRWWMLYKGPGMANAAYVPVVVEPAKKRTVIYDRTKQQMPSVEFTVTLALEG